MATYFDGGSAGGEGLHTLYLMNPKQAPYSDIQQHPNMFFQNPAQHHHFVAGSTADPSHGMVPRAHYNLWDPQPLSAGSSGHHLGFPRQGLSLSLSPQQHAYRADPGMQAPGQFPASGEDRMNSASSVSNNVLVGSKYLKATQELLDQVVNVGKGIIKTDGIGKTKAKTNKEGANQTGEGSDSSCRRGAELSTAQRQELHMKKAKLLTMLDEVQQRHRQYQQQMQKVVSSLEQAVGIGSAKSYTALALHTISKQSRCLKDAISSQIKATSRSLGEDEDCLGTKVGGSRLRQIDHQLRQQRALQQLGTIQHNAWRPQRGLPERAVSVLRAWLFEHFLHPYPKDSDKIMLAKQTGLTRSQVSNWFINARVRLWKPMVEEIYMEEVKEREQNGSEDNTNKTEADGASGSKSSVQEVMTKHDKSSDNLNASYDDHFSNPPLSASPMGSLQCQSGIFNLIGSSDMEAAMSQRGSPNKPRSSSDMQNSPSSILSMDMDMKRGETGRDQFGNLNHEGCFVPYPMGDIGRFNVPEQLQPPRFHGNGVSLTLGLPHGDNHLTMPRTQQNYLGRKLQVEAGGPLDLDALQASQSGSGYESIDIQSRKRFAAQLMPDFVA